MRRLPTPTRVARRDRFGIIDARRQRPGRRLHAPASPLVGAHHPGRLPGRGGGGCRPLGVGAPRRASTSAPAAREPAAAAFLGAAALARAAEESAGHRGEVPASHAGGGAGDVPADARHPGTDGARVPGDPQQGAEEGARRDPGAPAAPAAGGPAGPSWLRPSPGRPSTTGRASAPWPCRSAPGRRSASAALSSVAVRSVPTCPEARQQALGSREVIRLSSPAVNGSRESEPLLPSHRLGLQAVRHARDGRRQHGRSCPDATVARPTWCSVRSTQPNRRAAKSLAWQMISLEGTARPATG